MRYLAGRQETLRYHRELYRQEKLFTPGSWLARPASYIMNSLKVAPDRRLRVLDLGAGVGRHVVSMALKDDRVDEIVAVDVLPEAIDGLRRNLTEYGVRAEVSPLLVDVEQLEIESDYFDLVISCSCIEHVSSEEGFHDLLSKLRTATRPGGVNCFMINADVTEALCDGTRREALIELNLTGSWIEDSLKRGYSAWTITDLSRKPWSCPEEREGESFVVDSTCIQFTSIRDT